MAKNPTSKGRNKRQKLKSRYSKAREDAQLHGLIETTPEEALKDERVPPSVQGEQKIPGLDRDAVRKGWEVPEEVKVKVIERLSEPFFEANRVVVTREGKEVVVPPDRNLLKENAKVLVLADQRQWERDNPRESGLSKGASQTTHVNVLMADLAELFRRADEQEAGVIRVKEVGYVKADISGAEQGVPAVYNEGQEAEGRGSGNGDGGRDGRSDGGGNGGGEKEEEGGRGK